MPFLFFQFSVPTFLWLLVCLALGIAYAWVLYRPSGKKTASKGFVLSLAIFRIVSVAVILFLIISPPVKLTDKTLEKPLVIIAQDNSASVKLSEPDGFSMKTYTDSFKALKNELGDAYDIYELSFGAKVTENLNFNFKEQQSDISSVFQYIGNRFGGRNIGAVILATDGIYNHGSDPLFGASKIKSPVYPVALGDTIPKRDLLISTVSNNNIVYLGNQFQAEVTVEAYQCKGLGSLLTVSDKGRQIASQQIRINSDDFKETVRFNLPATQKGVEKFTFSIRPVSSELSEKNNAQSIFVEVIDGKQKILLIANAPHPDLGAIKQSVEANKNYELKINYADNVIPADLKDAGIVILDQLPSLTNPAKAVLSGLDDKPVWFILGAQSNTAAFSQLQGVLNIVSNGTTQEVQAAWEPDFFAFQLNDELKDIFPSFPPLLSPFGNYGLKMPASVLLKQQIGKVTTNNPLLLVADETRRRTAILTGEGFWRWRLENFKQKENHEAADELVSKVIQYLAARNDKRKFRVYPARNMFDENENIVLNAELYDDAYQLTNKPEAGVIIESQNGKSYNFTFSRLGNSYQIDAGTLPAGEYSYTASAKLDKDNYQAKGNFVITEAQAEYRQTTANHQLLYGLAKQSNGKLIYPSQLKQLAEQIRKNEFIKTISYENRRFEDLVNMKIIFFLILALLAVEWFIRKRSGEL